MGAKAGQGEGHFAAGAMIGETQYGAPLIVDNFSEGAARGLTRVRFERGNDEGY
jgi:hypothetical protein